MNAIQDEKARALITRLLNMIEQLSAENLSQVNMAPYLRQLTYYVLDSFGHRDAVSIQIDAPQLLDISKAMPCGLIVNELFTNILKHAFPPGFQGNPTVMIKLQLESGIYRLSISDNGVGMPPGFNQQSAQSLGLRLVNLWATHQLGGTLTVLTEPGTTFAIEFELETQDIHEHSS